MLTRQVRLIIIVLIDRSFMSEPSIKKLYFKYGSRVSSAVAELFYDRIEIDPELSGYFEHVDMDGLREHMGDLLCSMTGGPDLYKGQDLNTAHADYDISDDIFDRVTNHMSAALNEAGIEDADAVLIVAEFKAQKPQIVDKII